jgi:hypothetical protein
VQLRAAKEGRSPSEVVNDLLRQALRVEVEEATGAASLAQLIQAMLRGRPRQIPQRKTSDGPKVKLGRVPL